MFYDGTKYFYQLNLQGDVIGIVDTTGASVAKYAYDAWGRVVYSTGTMAAINPIRYRGYYYDAEMGMYYLQSRYYDPALKRFINEDSYLGTGLGFVGYNMFAYCNNNSVNYYDPTGFCYYNSRGQWCHDNWEYLGGYERKPEPAEYLGKTPTGRNVYISTDDNYSVTGCDMCV